MRTAGFIRVWIISFRISAHGIEYTNEQKHPESLPCMNRAKIDKVSGALILAPTEREK